MSAAPWLVAAILVSVGFAAGPILAAIADRLCVELSPVAGPHHVKWLAGAGMAVGLLGAAVGTPTLVSFMAVSLGIAVLLVISIVDLRERRIPNRLTYPLILACLGIVGVSLSMVPSSASAASSAVAGAVAFTIVLLIPHLVRPDAMGRGDVKLAVPLGFAIGWVRGDAAEALIAVGWTVALASAVGLLVAAMWRRRSIAFGPPLSLATVVAVVVLS